jgi:4a-hydroxytetrahydrobiopterin dehydratase
MKPAKLSAEQITEQLRKLGAEWKAVENHHLEKTFPFRNFRLGLDFTNKVGEIAEAEMHHPDIYLAWGKVRITIYTHSVDGLTELDFALAQKIDAL